MRASLLVGKLGWMLGINHSYVLIVIDDGKCWRFAVLNLNTVENIRLILYLVCISARQIGRCTHLGLVMVASATGTAFSVSRAHTPASWLGSPRRSTPWLVHCKATVLQFIFYVYWCSSSVYSLRVIVCSFTNFCLALSSSLARVDESIFSSFTLTLKFDLPGFHSSDA